MKKYIFLTNEGSTYQPNSECYEPDIENAQVIGFGQGSTVRAALRNLLKLNDYIVDTDFDEIFTLQLTNEKREYFSLKDITKKT